VPQLAVHTDRGTVGPGNGSPSATNVAVVDLGVVVSSTKAFSFHNRSSS